MKKSITLMVAVVGLAASFDGEAYTYFYNPTSTDVKILPIRSYATNPVFFNPTRSATLNSTTNINEALMEIAGSPWQRRKLVKYKDSTVPVIAYVIESPTARVAITKSANTWHSYTLDKPKLLSQSTAQELGAAIRGATATAITGIQPSDPAFLVTPQSNKITIQGKSVNTLKSSGAPVSDVEETDFQ